MPKFIVQVQEIHTFTVMVEAEDSDAARIAAEEVVNNSANQDGTDLNDEATYSRTVDRDEWCVQPV